MKKFLSVLFVLFTVNLQSFAVITPEEATSEAYIQNHGHSEEMSRLIDLQNAQINGTKSVYKEKEAWYTSKLPQYMEKPVNFVRRTFMYFDCGLDDGKFMQNDIKYTNRWDDL